jgi:hypothetical protein
MKIDEARKFVEQVQMGRGPYLCFWRPGTFCGIVPSPTKGVNMFFLIKKGTFWSSRERESMLRWNSTL